MVGIDTCFLLGGKRPVFRGELLVLGNVSSWKRNRWYKVGPLPVIHGVTTSISRVLSPVTHL